MTARPQNFAARLSIVRSGCRSCSSDVSNGVSQLPLLAHPHSLRAMTPHCMRQQYYPSQSGPSASTAAKPAVSAMRLPKVLAVLMFVSLSAA